MANYINRELLCEAYSHLDVDTYASEETRRQLREDLISFFRPRAQFIFGNDVEIQVDFEDGSLKTKIAVLGIVATLVSDYGSFRQGAEQLARDSAILAQAANLEMVFKTRAAHCDRIRIEKRTGVLGRIHALLRSIEVIRDNAGHHRFPSTERDLTLVTTNVDELSKWQDEAMRLIDKTENEDTKVCISSGFLEELELFPEQLPWVEEARRDSFRARLLNEEPELASRVDGIAARYARLLELTKQRMRRIVDAGAPRQS